MLKEVNAAVVFLSKFLQRKLNKDSLDHFKQALRERLHVHYKDHWFPAVPDRGSGYRCIRINSQVMDPLIYSVVQETGISNINLQKLFPDELTMWVDPKTVSYRIGENGSIGQLDLVEDQQPAIQKGAKDSTIGYPSSYVENSKILLASCKGQMVRGLSSHSGSHPHSVMRLPVSRPCVTMMA